MSNIENEQWEIKILGQKLTATTLSIAVTALSTLIGVLWFMFQLYQKIESIEEFADYNKRLIAVEQTTDKINDYTRDIKNDLKSDVRRLEKVVEEVERSNKQMSREVDKDLRDIRKETDNKIKRALDNPLANKE